MGSFRRFWAFIVFCLLLTAFFPIQSAFAQDTDTGSSGASNKRFNLRTNPLGLLVGVANFQFDVRIGDNLTVGPIGSYMNMSVDSAISSSKLSGIEAGGRVNYYFSGVFTDGWYVAGSASYFKIDISSTSKYDGVTGSASVSGEQFIAVGGYHWFWETFNLNLGAGATMVTIPSTTKITYSDNSKEDVAIPNLSGLALDFTIGATF